jgi:N-glycosylase/DNA lyase
MYRGAISLADLSGGFDLQATLESGQSYRWTREDGAMFADDGLHGGDAWYWTTVRPTGGDPAVIRTRQVDGHLEWAASCPAIEHLRRLLRLDDDLPAIRAQSPSASVVEAAWDAYPGMRLVRDPPFDTLVSFICSAQMHVTRIQGMQETLRQTLGTPVAFDGRTYHAPPTPAQLAASSEAELRDLGLGYRAPYVLETARMVDDGTADPAAAAEREYEAAREYLTRFVGVGDKVADCVCLFALSYLEAVPLDTWMQTTIADYFPDCDRDGYAATSRALRDALGGRYAGYVQTYLFHYLRQREA